MRIAIQGFTLEINIHNDNGHEFNVHSFRNFRNITKTKQHYFKC